MRSLFRSVAASLLAMMFGVAPDGAADVKASLRSCVTLIPSRRCSASIQPEVRLYSRTSGRCHLECKTNSGFRKEFDFHFTKPKQEIHSALDLANQTGTVSLVFRFFDAKSHETDRQERSLEILPVSTRSTQLLDGCWISLYHWSEEEGRWFNSDLGKLTAKDWSDQIRAMSRAGIRHAIIQNVFECDEYAGKHTMDMASYRGKAYYPSKRYPARHRLGADDPIEAILATADEVGMDVFLGVGLFAWFDFSPASLAWHKVITQELFDRYGNHPSLYGWYVSEEIFGSLYHEWEFVEPEHHSDIRVFFEEYQRFVRKLTPTKPVALAPNNERFEKYAKEWGEILPHVDILIPFGFARDADHGNIQAVASICESAKTHFWVDMEMFAWPIEGGLVPKTCPDLIREIRTYDRVEQIFGYQFTGLMNPPDSVRNLGGERSKQLYREYCEYYQKQMDNHAKAGGFHD